MDGNGAASVPLIPRRKRAPNTLFQEAQPQDTRLCQSMVAAMESRGITLQNLLNQSAFVLESIPEAVVEIDVHENIIIFNKAAEQLYGKSAAEVIGRRYSDVFHFSRLEDSLLLRTLYAGEELRRKELTWSSFLQKEVYFLCSTSRIFDVQGKLIGAIILLQDLTLQRKYEDSIEQAKLLATVSELAAGTAHEIRNPLTTVKGFLQLMAAKPDRDPDELEWIKLMIQEVDHVNSVISNFLLLSKPKPQEIKVLDLNLLLRDLLPLVTNQCLLMDISLETEIMLQPALVEGDANQIKQVILNLVNNALQAMPDGGKLSLSSRLSPTENFVEIMIKDTGVGIPTENLGKLFMPFFSTKPNGTGLGLTIACRIVRDLGGRIEVTSEINQGTCFVIKLPVIS